MLQDILFLYASKVFQALLTGYYYPALHTAGIYGSKIFIV